MVLLFVNQTADKQRKQRIEKQQAMERKRGYRAVNDDETHIFYNAVHGIAEENILHPHGVAVNGVEYCRGIHQKHGEKVIKIGYVTEKDEQRGKNKPDADVEENQARERIDECKESPRKMNPVNGRE